MIKKLLFVLLVLLIIAGCGKTEEVEAGILSTEATVTIGFNAVDAGTFVDLINDNMIRVGATMPIIGIKRIVNLNLGALTELNNKPIFAGCVDVNIKEVASLIGLDFWLLDPLKVGIWRGNDIITSEGEIKLGEAYGGVYANITIVLP